MSNHDQGEAQSDTKEYVIKRDLGNQALWVEIDTDQMIRVIDNIMNNAIKYSPDGGTITVRLTQNQNQILLSISDQGLGIPRKDLGKVFDRFYRADKARSRAQGGTGLGLAHRQGNRDGPWRPDLGGQPGRARVNLLYCPALRTNG